MGNQRDWKELTQKAANEQEPQKLLAIIEELNQALEERSPNSLPQLSGGVGSTSSRSHRFCWFWFCRAIPRSPSFLEFAARLLRMASCHIHFCHAAEGWSIRMEFMF